MTSASAVGDTRRVYEGVKVLRGEREKSPCNLSVNAKGVPLNDTQAIVKVWEDFLAKKFAATDAENKRPDMETLPHTQGTNQLTDKEVLKGLCRMNKGKARGPDNIPVIVYQASNVCRGLLIQLLQKMWDTEQIPEDFAHASFRMLFKNKGSKDDPSKYRCIGLLNHSYSPLSVSAGASQRRDKGVPYRLVGGLSQGTGMSRQCVVVADSS